MFYYENNRSRVCFEVSTAVTDAKGEFICTDLPANSRFDISVLKKGYEIHDTSEIYGRYKYPFRAGTKDILVTLKAGGVVKGQLVREGKPYQKAGIIVEARTTGGSTGGCGLTDEKGQFEIIGLAKTQNYTLTINSDFFTEAGLVCKPSEDIRLNVDSEPMVNVELQKGLPVTIKIVDKGTGDGIANLPASIALYDPDYRQLQKPVNIGVAEGWTNDAGEYTAYLTPNYYRLRTRNWADGREEDFEQHFIISDEQSSFNITLAVVPKPKVRGRLVNAGGEPVGGYVWVGGRRTKTDEHGRFEAEQPLLRTTSIYDCYAFDLENKLGRAFFWQKSDDADELEIVLEPLAGIVGRLIDQGGEAVTSIIPKVSIVNPNGDAIMAKSWIQDTTVEDDGSFSIERVPVGTEIVLKSAVHPGFGMIDIGSLEAGVIRTLEIGHLQPAEVFDVGEVFVKREMIPGFEEDKIDWDATLSGQVTNESGDVMVGFDVEISYENKRFMEVTDIKGQYKFVGLPGDKKVKLMVSGRTPKHSKTGSKNYRDTFDVICDGNDFDIQLSDK